MRKLLAICLAVMALVGLVATTGAGASAPEKKAPVKLKGKVINKGTKAVKGGKLEIEADDRYFKPTFIQGKAGKKVKVTVKNEGSLSHTFTADDGSFDEQLSPGDKVSVTVTLPADGSALAFHCDFHGDEGMKGAFFSKSGASATSSKKSGSGSSSGSGGYGY